jgi:hypothetical protein
MNETYTHKQVMKKLRLVSVGAFHRFKKKYPNAFILVYQGKSKDETLYNKQALDKFIELREFLKERPP